MLLYYYYMIFLSLVCLKRDAHERYRTSSVFTAYTTRRTRANIVTHEYTCLPSLPSPSHRHHLLDLLVTLERRRHAEE